MTQREEPPRPSTSLSELRSQLRPLLLSVPLLTVLTGVLFPLVLAGLARPLFPHQANGSLVSRDGQTVGSELVGQTFNKPGYFQPRPSAAGDGYDATASGGSNLGPANANLRESVKIRTEAYRQLNGLSPDTSVPIDAVTSSGSGLDPHISPANANLQVARVARERHLPEKDVRQLVAEHTLGRQLGFLGEARVNVLNLNLALDRASPTATER